MEDSLLRDLWSGAAAEQDWDKYFAKYGTREYPGVRPDELAAVLQRIHRIVWMPFREIIRQSGMTQRAFAEHFCIPLRTIESWARDISRPPLWAKKLIVEKLEQEQKQHI